LAVSHATRDSRPDVASGLHDRIAKRSARIGIVGLGYVGLPTAVAFAEAGFEVVGVDTSDKRREGVNAGQSHVEGVDNATVSRLVKAGRLKAVASLVDAGDLDIVDICVPTPLDKSRDPDVSAILSVIQEIRDTVRRGQLLILTSTTYPGTTVELLQPAVEAAGHVVGADVFIAFAPERIDPGNAKFGIRNTPRVVGGVTEQCTQLATELLQTVIDQVVPLSNPTAAEMSKLLENTFRHVNIALANEVAIMCRHLGLDVWEVIEAAATKPYGFMPFYPGPGLGGHCIPVDPSYLSWKLRRLNYNARFISLADDINSHMPEYVVSRAAEVLNLDSKSLRGSRVLVLGVAYKSNIADLRESPAVDVLTLLRRAGAEVSYADPHVPGPLELEGGSLMAVELSSDTLHAQDLVVIATAHAAFDWKLVRKGARAVLDTRGWSRGQHIPNWHTL
jgi:UDP-N-acetyl-D-glucosamine dehydrogenase